MKSKLWITGFFVAIIIALLIAASWVVRIDPYFHYHEPNTSGYFYPINNQRAQNDGISRNFKYEGLITGTSMTENFKTSEAEEIFGCSFIKVPYSGGSYKEMNDNLKVAIAHNPGLRIIVRGLDMGMFIQDKDHMRFDLGEYPTYLYNENPFDDVKYLFNRDILFSRVYAMAKENDVDGFQPGITSFDSYSNWMASYTFGVNTLLPDGPTKTDRSVEQVALTDEEKDIVLGTVHQNVTSLAEEHPEVTFYYFFTPYSALFWQSQINAGTFDKQIEAERIMIEEILKVANIKLYSINNETDIITDLNNYKDAPHYGEWVNSLMLKYMKEGKCLLTAENYDEYLSKEKIFYWNFDYEKCFKDQEDYESDYYSAALLDEELYGIIPHKISREEIERTDLKNARVTENQHDGEFGVDCKGSLKREPGSEVTAQDYIFQTDEYNGFKLSEQNVDNYRYLVFYGRKIKDHGQPSVYIYNEEGVVTAQITESYTNLDSEWHQYLIKLSDIKGNVDIIFQGGYIDSTGDSESEYVFSDIIFY